MMSVLVAGGDALTWETGTAPGSAGGAMGKAEGEKTKQRGTCIPLSSARRAAFKALVFDVLATLDGGAAPT